MLKLLNSTVSDSGLDSPTLPDNLYQIQLLFIIPFLTPSFHFFFFFYDFYYASPAETLENTSFHPERN